MNKNISELFDSFKDHNILIIGDIMIDSYLFGTIDRISPEAPVPIVSMTKQENRLGGAANVALNVQALGATPILCTVIGNDDNAVLIRTLCKENNIITEGIINDESRFTTKKTRIISDKQQVLRIDREITQPLSKLVETIFIKHIHKLIESFKIGAIIFEDYDKGVITPEIITYVLSLAQKEKIPTFVDPKKRNFLNYDRVTLFKPNFKEFSEGLKLELEKTNGDGLLNAAQVLHNKGIENVMVTLSENGVFISNGRNYSIIPALVRDIADVSGAGDTVISITSLCMVSGVDIELAAKIANIAGGIVCEKVGVVPIDKIELIRELDLALPNPQF